MELEALLRQNYDWLKGKQGKQKVLEFIDANPSVAGMDIVFVKMLTKVGAHIFKSDPDSLNGQVSRLYNYNMEGASKVDEILSSQTYEDGWSQYGKENLINMEAHFFSHAATIAEHMALKKRSLAWAQRWYDTCSRSAAQTRTYDSLHSQVNYAKAGDAARVMYSLTRNKEWLETALSVHVMAAGMAADKHPKNAARAYLAAADDSRLLYSKKKDEESAVEWYNNAFKAVNYHAMYRKSLISKAYDSAYHAASAAYEQTGDQAWKLRRWICAIKSAKISMNNNPEKAARMFYAAGIDSRNMAVGKDANINHDLSYHSFKLAAQLTLKHNPYRKKKALKLYSLAADEAETLFRITGYEGYQKCAEHCVSPFEAAGADALVAKADEQFMLFLNEMKLGL